MTATSPAVRQAVELLLGRRRELREEMNEITAALNSLGVLNPDTADTAAAAPVMVREPTRVAGLTIRAAVRDLVNDSSRVLSLDEVVAGVGHLFPDRTAEQIRSNVRSTLFQLTTRGEIAKHGRGQWGPLNADDPAVAAGSSDLSVLDAKGGGSSVDQDSPEDYAGAYHAASDTHVSDPDRGAAVAVP